MEPGRAAPYASLEFKRGSNWTDQYDSHQDIEKGFKKGKFTKE